MPLFHISPRPNWSERIYEYAQLYKVPLAISVSGFQVVYIHNCIIKHMAIVHSLVFLHTFFCTHTREIIQHYENTIITTGWVFIKNNLIQLKY